MVKNDCSELEAEEKKLREEYEAAQRAVDDYVVRQVVQTKLPVHYPVIKQSELDRLKKNRDEAKKRWRDVLDRLEACWKQSK